MSQVAGNKRAYHDYFIEDKFEAGLSLQGWEVKTARKQNVSLAESFVYIKDEQVYLKNAYFAPYENAHYTNQDSKRDRVLLLHKSEIAKLHKGVQAKGNTLICTKIYFNKRGLCKAEVALARGKKNYDKRQTLKERDIQREKDREVREMSK